MSLGKRVKYLRNQRGWSQDHLADICSVNTKTISRIECDKSVASAETKLALASAFDIEVSQLIYSGNALSSEEKHKQYILEVYYKEECIERRKSTEPFLVPNTDEEIYIEFKNVNYSEMYGSRWIVRKRKFMFFTEATFIETLQLFCEPKNDH